MKKLLIFITLFIITMTQLDAKDVSVSDNLKIQINSSSETLYRNAFLSPLSRLPTSQKIDFSVGFGFFRKLWVSSPSATKASDGLGPLYNARSCLACHIAGGRGIAPNLDEKNKIGSLVLRLSIPAQNDSQKLAIKNHKIKLVAEPSYGHQLQTRGVRGQDAEGNVHIDYEVEAIRLNDDETVFLQKPVYTMTHLAYGKMHQNVKISPRLAPPIIGLGLLASIADDEILKHADSEDADNNGISGRANLVWSKVFNKTMIGRFGYKAGAPTLDEQNQSAFSTDIGLSVPLATNPWGDCTTKQTQCIQAPHGDNPEYNHLEAHKIVTDSVLFYVENVAVPKRRNISDDEVVAGEKTFSKIGCAGCHQASFKTQKIASKPALSEQIIWPYSDLLLHDMGEGLADNSPEGKASGSEWRTTPLWGLGLTKAVNKKAGFLHDGRARTINEAILWHGGEALVARNTFIGLGKAQREQLLKFLDSL